MSRYEDEVLNEMVVLWCEHEMAETAGERVACEKAISSLLNCIVRFRKPPESISVEDGYGAMAVAE